MKALVFEEPRRATVSDLDVPAIAADEVLVRSRNVGIWDAGSYWWTGPQAAPFGFFNNPATPATTGAEVYSMLVVPQGGPPRGDAAEQQR